MILPTINGTIVTVSIVYITENTLDIYCGL